MTPPATPPRGPTMRMPRVRFTVRWMRIAVTVIALYLGAEATIGRGPTCRERARRFERMAQGYERISRSGVAGGNSLDASERESFHRSAMRFLDQRRDC